MTAFDLPSDPRAAEMLEAIWEHWVLHRAVPVDVAKEMRVELTDHLSEALANGRGIDEVIGEDPRRFADEWAQSEAPPSRFDLVQLSALVFFAGGAGIVLSEAAFTGSLDVRVPVVSSLIWAVIGLAVVYLLLGPPGSRLRRKGRPRSKVMSALFAALVGALALPIVLALSAFEDPITVGLPWPVVLIWSVAGFITLLGLPLLALVKTSRQG